MKFTKLNYTEPAVLRGIVMAVLGLAASLGLVLPNDQITGAAEGVIVAIPVVLPILQAIWTRAAVWSKRGKDRAVAKAVVKAVDDVQQGEYVVKPQVPGEPDHAAPEQL